MVKCWILNLCNIKFIMASKLQPTIDISSIMMN